jgi:hypothetical protein
LNSPAGAAAAGASGSAAGGAAAGAGAHAPTSMAKIISSDKVMVTDRILMVFPSLLDGAN